MTKLPSAFLEASEEIRINKARFVLSLVSVAVAVWAMGTVMALGTLMTDSVAASFASDGGVPGTLRFSINSAASADEPTVFDPFAPPQPEPSGVTIDVDEDGRPIDRAGDAIVATAESVKTTLWTRDVSASLPITAPGLPDCSGVDRDDTIYLDPTDFCYHSSIRIEGTDPAYSTIFSKALVNGRLLNEGDDQLRMNPTVVNETLWRMLGEPDPATHPQFIVRGHPESRFTIVGVVASTSSFDEPLAYTPYAAFLDAMPASTLKDSLKHVQGMFVAPADDVRTADQVLRSQLAGRTGSAYTVSSGLAHDPSAELGDMTSTMMVVTGVIGGIVILIGAFGLLTVSIVTVRQRVREIGIRRSMGASARRVFFAVFFESVVATTFAGLLGVIASIITIRAMPVSFAEAMGIDPTSSPYPLSAALAGVGIAAGVGALCGIIPATIAVRIKPIDAIRF